MPRKETGEEGAGRTVRHKRASVIEMKVKVRLLEEFWNKEGTDADSTEAMACLPLGNFKPRGDSSIFWIPLWFAGSMRKGKGGGAQRLHLSSVLQTQTES